MRPEQRGAPLTGAPRARTPAGRTPPAAPRPSPEPAAPRGRYEAAERQVQRLKAEAELPQEPAASGRHGDPTRKPGAAGRREGKARRTRPRPLTPARSRHACAEAGRRACPRAPGVVLGPAGPAFFTPGVEDMARQVSPRGAVAASALPTCWLCGGSHYIVSFPREETNAKATSFAREERQSRSRS